MNNVKNSIRWADFTWNPVTGCLHNCSYCYARKLFQRFKVRTMAKEKKLQILTHVGPDFWDFRPMFWPSRLDQPAKRKKPAHIFVVSMGDLFGDWVPDEWIERVFKACEQAPQHTYYFLTKNPKRYLLFNRDILNKHTNWWFGASATGKNDKNIGHPFHLGHVKMNGFISVEPIMNKIVLGEIACPVPDWLIVGAETGNRKGKIIPKREWILDIRRQCKEYDIPLFEKDNLANLNLPGGLIQTWPKEKI